MTQFVSGHGRNRAYLHRFHVIDNPNCDCASYEPQTVEHLVFWCTKFNHERKQLIQALKFHRVFFPCNLSIFVINMKLFESLHSFLLKIYKKL